MIIQETDTKLLDSSVEEALSLPPAANVCNNFLISAVLRYAGLTCEKAVVTPKMIKLSVTNSTSRGFSGVLRGENELVFFAPSTLSGFPTIDGYTKDERLSAYLSQFGKTAVYKKDAGGKTAVIVSFQDIQKETWQTQFAGCIGKIFDYPAVPKEFWKKIIDGDAAYVVAKFDECCASVDVRKAQITRVLTGWADRERISKIETLKNEIGTLRDTIQDLVERIQHSSQKLTDNERDLSIYESADPEQDTEWINFFLEREDVTVYSTSNGVLRYYVTGPMEFYDQRAFELSMENPKSVINRTATERVKKLLKALFSDKKGKYISSGCFKLTGWVVAPNSGTLKDNFALPHPHIYFFGCLGGNSSYLSQFAKEGDWKMQVEQTRAAVRNINWGDGAVVGRMVEYLDENYSTVRGILYKGKMVTPKEFMEHVEKETTEKGEENG